MALIASDYWAPFRFARAARAQPKSPAGPRSPERGSPSRSRTADQIRVAEAKVAEAQRTIVALEERLAAAAAAAAAAVAEKRPEKRVVEKQPSETHSSVADPPLLRQELEEARRAVAVAEARASEAQCGRALLQVRRPTRLWTSSSVPQHPSAGVLDPPFGLSLGGWNSCRNLLTPRQL